jgi:hypothetical protein
MGWPATVTLVAGAENLVAFSISSASRWMTSTQASRDLELADRQRLDPLVVGHLGGGGADEHIEWDRLLPLVGQLGSGQDDEVLGVAAHPGDEVVQPKQLFERVRARLVLLELADQLH